MDRLIFNALKNKNLDSEIERKIQNELLKTFYVTNFNNSKENIKEKSILNAISVSKPVKIINKKTLNVNKDNPKTLIRSQIQKPNKIPMKNIMLVPLRLTINKDSVKSKLNTEMNTNKSVNHNSYLETLKKEEKSKMKKELIFSSYKLSRNYRKINQIFSKKMPKLNLSHFHETSSFKNLTKNENSKPDFGKSSEEYRIRGSEIFDNKNIRRNFISSMKKDLLLKDKWELNCKSTI